MLINNRISRCHETAKQVFLPHTLTTAIVNYLLNESIISKRAWAFIEGRKNVY